MINTLQFRFKELEGKVTKKSHTSCKTYAIFILFNLRGHTAPVPVTNILLKGQVPAPMTLPMTLL